MSECQNARVPHETYTVTVRYPKSLRTRVANTWNRWKPCCRCFLFFVLICIFSMIFFSLMCGPIILVAFVVQNCHTPLGMELQSLSIRDMAVYQNGTAGWQVDSAFDVTLDTKNPNHVAGCFTTLRRVVVRVEYKGQIIVQQDVPVGFGLKPRRSRPVTMALQGQQFPLKNPDVGPYLQAEMKRGSVRMDIYLYARYLRNDRLARWKKRGCVVVASAPASSKNSTSSLLSKNCYPV